MANYDLTYEGSRVQGILDTGNSLKDAGYIFRGEATPSTVPGTPTERVAYIGGPGTYTNFGSSITVPVGRICVFKYTGSTWSNQVIDTKVSDGAAYKGIATPTTNPGSPIGSEFYIAVQAGTYTNFGNAVVTAGLNVIKYNGSAWSVDQVIAIDAEPTQGSANLVKSGGVLNSIIQNGPAFDLSAYNAQGGTLATYADISAALTALNALPADFKKGGMSIKFVLSSDNKYVQARLIANAFTTDATKWQLIVDYLQEDFNVSTNGKVNELIKELYLANIDATQIAKIRFFKAVNIGGVYYSGILFVDSSNATVANMRIQVSTKAEADAYIAHPIMGQANLNMYALVDWSKMQDGTTKDYIGKINPFVSDISYSPTLKSFLEGIFDVTLFNGGATYSNVADAATAIPASLHRGGMIMRYKDSSTGTYKTWENIQPNSSSFKNENSWINIRNIEDELFNNYSPMVYSNKKSFNKAVKELYIQKGDITNSNCNAVSIYNAFSVGGGKYRTGYKFYDYTNDVTYAVLYIDYDSQTEARIAAKGNVLHNGYNYIVSDIFELVEDGNARTINNISFSKNSYNISYSPVIKEYIRNNDLINSPAVNVAQVSYWKHSKNSYGADILSACETIIPIRVKPGHKYIVECNQEFVDNTDKYLYMKFFTGKDEDGKVDELSSQRWDNNNLFFIAPKDANYLKIQLIHIDSSMELTVDAAYNSNIRIYDATYYSVLSHGDKLIGYEYSGQKYANGLEIYNDYIFQGMSNGDIDIYNLQTCELVQSIHISLPSGETGELHFNHICFGNKDSVNDEFPILWVSPNGEGKIVGLYITRNGNTFNAVNRYEIVQPVISSDYVGNIFFDFKKNRLISQAYHKNSGVLEGDTAWYGNSAFCEHQFTNLREVESASDYESTSLVNIGRRLWAVQDGFVVDDNLYFLVGIGNQRLAVVCYNINEKDIAKEWDLRELQYSIGNQEEPEGICIYKGTVYLSTTYGLYKIIL